MFIIFLLLIESINVRLQYATSTNCTNDIAIIDKLLNGTYNKHRIPGGSNVLVQVEFWIQEITSISEITNDFEMDIYINEIWLDPSLNFEQLNPCRGNLSLNHQVLDRLWVPNSCFVNSKMAQIHDSPFRNVFLLLYKNGSIWVNYRILVYGNKLSVKVRGPCMMDLSQFPMDTQSCLLIYESFNYNNGDVRMRWSSIDEPVYRLKEMSLPDFDLLSIKAWHQEEIYPAGMWDELHVKLTFERRYVWYILQSYVPTYLTIAISWVSFTLGPRAIPARTMLGVNALLAMIFQFGNIMRNLPRVSYVKAIDVWMLVSMTFIFASIVELAIIGYMVRDESSSRNTTRNPFKSKQQNVTSTYNNQLSSPIIGGNRSRSSIDSTNVRQSYVPRFTFHMPLRSLTTSSSHHNRCCCCYLTKWTPDQIDRTSIILFPTLFALFNIIYWSYYARGV